MTQIELTRIARNADYLQRVRYLMIKAAVSKLNAQDPPAGDVLLGQRVLRGSESVEQWAMATVTNPSIAAGAHEPDGSTIVDGDLEFTINSLWDAFAK